MKNDYSKEAFLLKIFKEELNHSQNIIKYSKKPNGKNLRIEESVRRYLAIQERLNEVALSSDNKMKYLKMLYHEKYCAKKENIHSQNIKNLDEKLQMQRDSLDAWIDYLVGASYPMWFKYWCFKKIFRIGKYHESTDTFERRTPNSLEPFIECNPEIVSKIYDIALKHFEGKEKSADIEAGRFDKLYYRIYQETLKNKLAVQDYSNGIWVKYNEGSLEDAIKLCDSLQGKNTGWCTNEYEMAKEQICGSAYCPGGDFYVYYTIDENRNYTNPRIAIKMKHKNEFSEIRGIGPNQNLEDGFELILVDKLNEFDIDDETKKEWIKLCLDSRELTRLLQKTKRKEKLTLEEMRFVFLFDKNEQFRWQNYEKLERIKSGLVITDRALLLDAVERNEFSLQYASEDLKSDRKFIIDLVKHKADVLRCVSEKFKDDKEFILEVVKQNGLALKYVLEKFKNDKEIVLVALKQNISALQYVGSELKNDEEFIIELLSDKSLFPKDEKVKH